MLRKITTRAELVELARELGVRPDWHEPDEQDLLATVAGTSFDNAGFWPTEECAFAAPETVEMHVTLWRGELVDGRWKKDQVLATVNLATLFAWATGHEAPQCGGCREVDELLRRTPDADHPRAYGVRALLAQRDAYAEELAAARADQARQAHAMIMLNSKFVAVERARDELRTEVEELRAQVAEYSNELTNLRASRDKLADEASRLRHSSRTGSPAESLRRLESERQRYEATWRSAIAAEVYAEANKIERELENRSLGVALAAIVRYVGDQVGRMS